MKELEAQELPVLTPEGLIEWATKTLLKEDHVLLYRSGWYADPLTDIKESCVDLRCSVCGKTAKAEMIAPGCSHAYHHAPFGFADQDGTSVISGDTLLCPICGQPVKAVYVGSVGGIYVVGSYTPLVVTAIRNRLVLTYWTITRLVDDTARETLEVKPKAAYVVERKKINCFSYGTSWYSRCQYKDEAGKLSHVFPWSLETLYGTTAENSKLDLYLKCEGSLYPVSYLRLWVQRPRVENLLVQGAGHLVQEMIQKDCTNGYHYWNGAVNIPKLKDVIWREKRPAQMLGITKDAFRAAVQQKWNVKELTVYREIRARGENFNLAEDMKFIRKLGMDHLEVLLKYQGECQVMRSVRYLLKQKKRDPITLTDYWRLVVQNGGSLRDSSVRYPQNLKTAHDHESARQRYIEKQGYTEQFAKRTAQLSGYAYEADGLIIRPVASAEELYAEGKALSHCVYSYLKRHVFGETAIMLIRQAEAPEKPFFTLELNEQSMTVRQNRGKHNCARTTEVAAFEEKWLTWAREQKKKEGIAA